MPWLAQARCSIGSLLWPDFSGSLDALSGSLRELRMYGQALRDSEMAALYQQLHTKWKLGARRWVD